MNNQSFSKIWIIVLIVLIGGGVLVYQYFGVPKEEAKVPGEKVPEEITKDEIVKVDENLVFDKFGFSLFLPDDWRVEINEIKEVSAPYGRFSFSFIPPEGLPSGWSFWGVLYIDIYEAQSSIEEWIEKYLPDYKDDLVITEEDSIGGKPVFLLDKKEGFWVPRYIILGTEYSYSYGFSQDGANNFAEIIEKEIFPNITIK